MAIIIIIMANSNAQYLCVEPTVFNCWPIENSMARRGGRWGGGTTSITANDNLIEDILWPCTVGRVITVSRSALPIVVYCLYRWLLVGSPNCFLPNCIANFPIQQPNNVVLDSQFSWKLKPKDTSEVRDMIDIFFFIKIYIIDIECDMHIRHCHFYLDLSLDLLEF